RPGEREELYRDGVEWYRRYGVTMRPVPRNYGEYRAEWKRVCRDVLEMTPAAERAVEMALRNRSLGVPFLPWWTKPLQPFVVTPILQLTAIGGLPDPVRRRFGIPWRIDQEIEYRTMQVAVREWFRWLPEALKYGPVAASARKRAAEAMKQNAGASDRAGAA
ncbi:MAG TPA: oxygenase MpaB family protein, partial [Acidimicrobiales bacterium]|nr:oxygenase MpaB family protein [Acidimicrobiales bacterium]